MNLTKETLTLLQQHDSGACVSIYIPTHRASSGDAMQQDITRYKNALQSIKNNPLYERTLDDTMAQLDALVHDIDFWKHQDEGLAIFADEKSYITVALPFEPQEEEIIDVKYRIAPLILMKSIAPSYYALDVNTTRPRLFTSTHGVLEQMSEDELSLTLDDFMPNELKKEHQHQAAPSGAGDDKSFHSHNPADTADAYRNAFMKELARRVDASLEDDERPLVLLGTDERIHELTSHLTHKTVISDVQSGNVEHLDAAHLYDLTIDPVCEHIRSHVNSVYESTQSFAPERRITGEQILARLTEGNIDTLFVPCYRNTNDSARISSGQALLFSHENIDEQLIRDTLRQGGSIYAREVVNGEVSEPVAITRY